MTEVVVAGAGLAGSMAAIYLARRGFGVHVVERRDDPRRTAPDSGRSINLGLSQRGLMALRQVGLLDQLWPMTTPMRGRMVHAPDGSLSFHPYGTGEDQILHSVLRDDLNTMLIEHAETYPGVRFDFGHKVVGLDKTGPAVTVRNDGADRRLTADLVIGADGAFSAVRGRLLHGERADFHQEFMDWGYKEITIPAGADIQLEALHLWPGHTGLVVAHPNHDTTLTATMFLPCDGPNSFADLTEPAAVARYCATEFSDLADLVPDLVDQFLSSPVGHLVTIRTTPWRHAGKVVLVGDAAHAVYPFYGQGMNAAFEDCTELDACLAAHPGDLSHALREFEQRRRPHTDVLAELSKQNFLELRDGMRTPLFLVKKKADLMLHRLLPRLWTPLYTMISHTTVPYGEALARARRQDRVLGAVATLSTVAAGVAVTGRLATRSRRLR